MQKTNEREDSSAVKKKKNSLSLIESTHKMTNPNAELVVGEQGGVRIQDHAQRHRGQIEEKCNYIIA